jgi:hypothetical protein
MVSITEMMIKAKANIEQLINGQFPGPLIRGLFFAANTTVGYADFSKHRGEIL